MYGVKSLGSTFAALLGATYSALFDSVLVESRPLDDLWLQIIVNFGNKFERKDLNKVSKCHEIFFWTYV